jgi:26S proteasome regulatory subunit N13
MSFNPAQLQALMQAAAAGQAAAAPPHLTFKAGILNQSGTTVTADPRRGTIKFSTQDGVLHLEWILRPSGSTEFDLMLFNDSWTFSRINECLDGRVYLLKFKDNLMKHWFWLQEPVDEKKDLELEQKINLLIKGETNFSNLPPVTTTESNPTTTV